MIHILEGGVTYDSSLEVWRFEGDTVSFMTKSAAMRIIEHVRRCEANARREFAEVVRLYSLIHKVDPSQQSPPKEPT